MPSARFLCLWIRHARSKTSRLQFTVFLNCTFAYSKSSKCKFILVFERHKNVHIANVYVVLCACVQITFYVLGIVAIRSRAWELAAVIWLAVLIESLRNVPCSTAFLHLLVRVELWGVRSTLIHMCFIDCHSILLLSIHLCTILFFNKKILLHSQFVFCFILFLLVCDLIPQYVTLINFVWLDWRISLSSTIHRITSRIF